MPWRRWWCGRVRCHHSSPRHRPRSLLPCPRRSGAEEYVPPHVDYHALGARLAAAMGSCAVLRVVEGAPHNLEGKEREAALAICAFVEALG